MRSLCDCACSHFTGGAGYSSPGSETDDGARRRSATCICTSSLRLFALHPTPACCDCFCLSDFSKQLIKIPRGVVYALISQTFCLCFFSISAFSASSLHTDIDRNLIEKLPLESSSSSVSSLVTLSTPGVAADSNGLFHGLGDHASNSFSVDGQPISDQQSKVFSNQIPSNSIQSIQVIAGAPPAEYGDKTSLVIQVTTRSGQGLTKPTGSITTSYGSFGSATGGFDIGYGSQKWGNFFELDGLNTGRFLDTPEFVVFHDKGNEQNVFDRVDYQFTAVDAIHLNLNYSRS